tara:strand:- start:128 stop:478 length:351 start_codon:yes stop_codon:yes gene_type:complete
MSTVKLSLGLTENGTVNTPQIIPIPATGSSATLLHSRYRYGTALVQNVGVNDICIRVDGVPTDAVYHIILSPRSQAEINDAAYVDVKACGYGAVTSSAVVFSVQTNDSVVTPATSY